MFLVREIIALLQSDYVLNYGGMEYTSVDEVKAAAKRSERIIIESMKCEDNRLRITLIDNPAKENDPDVQWIEQYRKNFGTEPSFF